MKKKAFAVFPGEEEIMKKLLAVHKHHYPERYFYPCFLEFADQKLSAEQIATVFFQKTQEFTQNSRKGIFQLIINVLVPDYIDALVEDKEVSAEAKKFLAILADKEK
jgi:hypothetical protein